MTTILDPGGSPSPIYNKDGTTIDAVACAGLNAAGSAAIVRYAQVTVVVATTSVNNRGLHLPTDAEIGDVVEVYQDTQDPVAVVYPVTGSLILSFGSGGTGVGSGASFRKVTSDTWGCVGQ